MNTAGRTQTISVSKWDYYRFGKLRRQRAGWPDVLERTLPDEGIDESMGVMSNPKQLRDVLGICLREVASVCNLDEAGAGEQSSPGDIN